jgi:hypothetical protein
MKILMFIAIFAFSGFVAVQADSAKKVDMVNFVHAETVNYFTKQQEQAMVNTFKHDRAAVSKDNQTIIRSNTDLLYSTAIVDVSEGATFTLPEGKAFQLMELIDENHMIPAAIYAGESVTLAMSDLTSGSFIYILMRTAVTAGIENAHRQQDAAIIDAEAANPYVGKAYNNESLDVLRSAFEADVNSVEPEKAFGKKFLMNTTIDLV